MANYTFPEGTEISDPTQWFGSLNSAVNDALGLGIMLIVFTVTFTALKGRYPDKQALTFAMFVTWFMSVIFGVLGLVNGKVVVVTTLILALSALFTFMDER